MATAPASSVSASPRRAVAWRVAWSLASREIIRFFRQPNRVIGALAQPILFWLLFGAGLQRTFALSEASGGQSFLTYYYPGTLVLMLLFTAIFSTISVIEDRKEGFLQAVLVAPIPRWSMVLGKVLGGAILATIQALVFLLLAFTLRIDTSAWALCQLVALIFVTGIALTALGLIIAWPMDSTQGFHAIMNLLLMPMWLLSGAFFPIPPPSGGESPGQLVLHWIMRLNPLSYAVGGVRNLLFAAAPPDAFWAPTLPVCWAITAAFAAAGCAGAWWVAGRRVRGDLL